MSKPNVRSRKRFWGHAGFAFVDAPMSSIWFPITADTADELEKSTSPYSAADGWIAIETLKNRMVMLDPQQVIISLLDDADEWPDGDSGQPDVLQDYAGISPQIYKIMAAWADRSGEFESLGSQAERSEALSLIEAGKFLDRPEALDAYLRHTRVHFTSGATLAFELDHESLLELIDIEGDAEVRFVSLRQTEGVDRRLPLNKLAMIEIPLIELEAARLELFEE